MASSFLSIMFVNLIRDLFIQNDTKILKFFEDEFAEFSEIL